MVFETKYREYVAYGARTSETKYVRLRQVAEASVGPSAFRHRLRVDGDVPYELRLRTSDWIDSVAGVGLGSTERAEVVRGGHVLALSLRRGPDGPARSSS